MEGTQRLWAKYQRNFASDERMVVLDNPYDVLAEEDVPADMDTFGGSHHHHHHHGDDIDLQLLEDEPHGDDDDDDSDDSGPANICVNFDDFAEHGATTHDVEAMNVDPPSPPLVDTAAQAAAAIEPMVYLDSSQSELATPEQTTAVVEAQSARDVLCQTLLIQLMTRYDANLRAREEQTKQRRTLFQSTLKEFHDQSTAFERLQHFIRTGIDTIRQRGMRTLSPEDLLRVAARLNWRRLMALVASGQVILHHAYYRNYLILVIGRDHFIILHKNCHQ